VKNQEVLRKLVGWFMGFTAGFLLRGNLVRASNDPVDYISTGIFLVVGFVFLFVKPKPKA